MVADDEAGLTVAQMSSATGLTAHTLRYYERAGLIRPVTRTSGNQRRYSPEDVSWVAFLMRLRETGMSIAQMRRYADLREQGAVTTEARLRLLEAHQEALRAQISGLRAHERALAKKIDTYQRDLSALHNDTPTENGADHD